VAHDTNKWLALVNAVIKLLVPQNVENILD
jgi:hypothetical protein